jgi:AcrR family transcriptional regulator
MSTDPLGPARRHRTQRERSDATRELLLDATITCLVESGYANTSVQGICARAGVSRGAQQHHFSSKADLMARALEHLFGKLTDEISEAPGGLPSGPDRVAALIDLLWRSYSGTLSTAAMELWVAARTDPELRAALLPVDRALGHTTLELYRDVISDEAPTGQVDTMLLLTVNLTRGLALDAMIGGDPARRERLLTAWKAMVTAVLHPKQAG